jgi:hypothetical protein
MVTSDIASISELVSFLMIILNSLFLLRFLNGKRARPNAFYKMLLGFGAVRSLAPQPYHENSSSSIKSGEVPLCFSIPLTIFRGNPYTHVFKIPVVSVFGQLIRAERQPVIIRCGAMPSGRRPGEITSIRPTVVLRCARVLSRTQRTLEQVI